jgi:hypothetical protein
MASHAGQGLAGGLRQTLRPARELPETPFGQRPDPSLLRGALMALSVAPIPHPGWCAGEKGHKGKGAGWPGYWQWGPCVVSMKTKWLNEM